NVKAMTAVSVNHWSRPGLPRVPVFIRGVAETHIVGEVYIVLANNELWIAEVPEPPWNFLSRGRIRTEDEADLIECTIEPDAVSRDVVEFVLSLGPDVTWMKQLVLWGAAPEGILFILGVEGHRSSSKAVEARQVNDGLKLT